MLTQILLFGILISGSVWGSAVCKKRFEDLLPITCSMIVVILFLCGVAGLLKQGVFVALAICFGLWMHAIVLLVKEKTWLQFVNNLVTPAFCLFVVAYIVLTYTNYGMMAATWDEFSHWADIVKAMVAVDDFGTNPQAQSLFQSYPPGMSLFQYFFQKVFLLLNRNEVFSEWRMYFSYQLLFLSFLMPFLRGLTFEKLSVKTIFHMFVAAVLCCLGPMLIFEDIYIIILIDAFLGLIAGTGLAKIFVTEKKDWSYDAYILLNIVMLILVKDAGMLFAVFVFVTYILDNIFYRKAGIKRNGLWSVLALMALLVPKKLWEYNIKINNANVAFSNPIDLQELFRVLLGIEKTNYRVEVLENFFDGLFTRCFEISVFQIKIPYIILFVVLAVVCYVISRIYTNWNIKYAKKYRMVVALLGIETIIYVFGLCVTYMFKFSEYEAVRIASFERYMNIMLEGIVIFLLMLIVNYVSSNQKQKYMGLCILLIVLAILPWGMIKDIGTRATVANTVNTRIRYIPIVEQIEKIAVKTGERYNINVISQESAGYDAFVLRYSLRPHTIVGSESMGQPFYEGDIWTVEKTPKQWREELKSNVDYVAIYHLNEYFMENYSEVFEKPEEIRENGIYKVNKETGTLSLCE